MGNWNINIQGIGCHHNKNAKIDADLAMQEFVQYLKRQGHTVESATFTYGGKVDILDSLPSTVKCTINGKEHVFNKNKVSYEDIVSAAGYQTDRVLSVVYVTSLYDGKIDGILHKGQEVFVSNGAKFDVGDTSNA